MTCRTIRFDIVIIIIRSCRLIGSKAFRLLCFDAETAELAIRWQTDKSETLLGYKLQLVIASCHNFSQRGGTNGVSTIFPQLNQNGRKPVSRLALNTIPRGSGPFQCSIYGRRLALSQPMS